MRQPSCKKVLAAALVSGCVALSWLATSLPPAQARAAVATSAPTSTPVPATPSVLPPAWAAFENAWANISAYNATVTTFEQKGTQTQNTVFDYTFRKPSSATVHFIKGINEGVTVVWNGGTTVTAHRGGFLALFKKTFPLHDPQVTTIRGSSVDQLSFAAILAHSQGTPGTISQATGPTILGIPTEAVTLVATSSIANTGLTREIVDISTTTNLPIRVLGYEGDTLVRQIDFSNVKLER